VKNFVPKPAAGTLRKIGVELEFPIVQTNGHAPDYGTIRKMFTWLEAAGWHITKDDGTDECVGRVAADCGDAARGDPADALRGAHRSTLQSGGWAQKSLVVIQAALSLVLLCAAGFLIQSLRNMQHQHFGFETANRFVSHIEPRMAGYTPEKFAALYQQLHDSLAAIPGVSQVSFSMYSPMDGDNWSEQVYIQGQAPPPPGFPGPNQDSANFKVTL
jgi:hypothetical protein